MGSRSVIPKEIVLVNRKRCGLPIWQPTCKTAPAGGRLRGSTDRLDRSRNSRGRGRDELRCHSRIGRNRRRRALSIHHLPGMSWSLGWVSVYGTWFRGSINRAGTGIQQPESPHNPAIPTRSDQKTDLTTGCPLLFSNFREVQARLCLQNLRLCRFARCCHAQTRIPNQSSYSLRLLHVPRGNR